MFLIRLIEYLFGKSKPLPSTITRTRRVNGKITRKPIVTRIENKKPISKAIPSDIRDQVWLNYHGAKIIGQCYCCGKTIEKYKAGWHCSHVIARDKGGKNTISNLRTCCAGCNLGMGNCYLYKYIKDKELTGPGSKEVAYHERTQPLLMQDGRNR